MTYGPFDSITFETYGWATRFKLWVFGKRFGQYDPDSGVLILGWRYKGRIYIDRVEHYE